MSSSSARRLALLVVVLLLCCGWFADGAVPAGQGERADAGPALPREGLVLRPVGRYGRTPIHRDAVEAEVVAGRWKAPQEGDKVSLPGGTEQKWEKVAAGKDGNFNHPALRGGYLHLGVESPADKVMLLEASGHGVVYVNGEPRTGDPYGTGYVRLPVLLRKGANDFLFQGAGRGRGLRAQLTAPPRDVFLVADDSLLPDLLVGEKRRPWAAVVVVNATTRPAEKLVLRSRRPLDKGGVVLVSETVLPPLPPLSNRKVGVRLEVPEFMAPGKQTLAIELARGDGGKEAPLDALQLAIQVRRPDETHKRTFVSAIDGSVQYYAVNPARPLRKDAPPSALFLSLHGASVEAIGQANAYAGKTWGHLVAPTNRRPYGFDWEDWGRLDALEVLDLAQQELGTDPQRTYLTGHSMGGHGTWHVGVTFPDRFAAIGPSAGWVDFARYGGGQKVDKPTPMQSMLQRAALPSDTLALAQNYAQHGVYGPPCPATRWPWRRTTPSTASTSCTAPPTTTCRSATPA
jgi:hypothetical protein